MKISEHTFLVCEIISVWRSAFLWRDFLKSSRWFVTSAIHSDVKRLNLYEEFVKIRAN